MIMYKFTKGELEGRKFSRVQIRNLYNDMKEGREDFPDFSDWLENQIADGIIEEIPENVEIPLELNLIISDEDIDVIMDLGLHGGIGYWCLGGENVNNLRCSWEKIISRGGSLKLEDESEEEHILTRGNLITAIKKWILNPVGWRGYDKCIVFKNGHLEIDTDKMDGGLSDIFIQCALFGNVIYS